MNIDLQKTDSKDLKDILHFEKISNSRVFKAYSNLDDVKKYATKSEIFFIIADGNRVGTISYENKENGDVEFDGLIVDPEFQGKGIAIIAMREIMKTLGKTKLIYLYTHPENSAAIAVYLKNGFYIKKWVDNHFGDGEPRLYLEKKQP